MLTKYLDILAFEWIRRRAKHFVHGGIPVALAHPLPMLLANEAAEFIKDSEAENGVIVMFHSDRYQRDVVFDVRWADGQTVMERYFAHAKICPTLRAVDGRDSAPSQASPTPEVDSLGEADTTPPAAH